MYAVSSQYMNEIAQRSVVSAWYGTITLTSGYVIYFGAIKQGEPVKYNNLDQNKSKITRQYTKGETLEIGNAFSSELVLGLRDTDDLQVSDHHYEFYGAVIDLRFRLYGDSLANTEAVSGKKYEDVPCGLFTVEDAEFTYHTVVLTAYDNLYKAAKTNIPSKITNRPAYAALVSLCTTAGLTLGTTQQEIEAMPNGTLTWSLSTYKKGTPVKDIMEDICTVLCANAVCDRAGNVIIKQYGFNVVRTVGDNQRYSSSYIDYLGRYTKIALETDEGNEEVYDTTRTYVGGKPLTLSIGKNPLINKKNVGSRRICAVNIINQLVELLYAPLDIKMPQDPAIDIGDAIQGTSVNFDNPITFINTKNEIPLYGQMSVKSAGGSYELANKKKATKMEKRVSDLEDQVVEVGNNVAIIQTELSEISGIMNVGYILPIAVDLESIANGTSRDVLTFEFVLSDLELEEELGQALSFHAELCFYVNTAEGQNSFADGIVTVKYTFDGVETSSVVYTYRDGWKILTLNGFFPSVEAGEHTFVVSMSVSGGEIADPS